MDPSRRARAGALVLLCFTSLSGCIDQAVCAPIPGTTTLALRLSELGLFAGDPAQQVPAEGVFAYTVNAPLYSDGAAKHRFIALPVGAMLGVTGDQWELPLGTLLIKTFAYPRDVRDPSQGERLIETRILRQTEAGLVAGTYVWDDDQADARCSPGNLQVPTAWTDAAGVPRQGSFHVPGTSQCQGCHADRGLGLRTRQMDVPAAEDGEPSQVERLWEEGALDVLPDEELPRLVDPLGDGDLTARARSYLDANCGHCHGEGGRAEETRLWLDFPTEDPERLGIGVHGAPVHGATLRIDPGDPEGSIVIARMRSADPEARMPQAPNALIDEAGVGVVADWIRSLEETP